MFLLTADPIDSAGLREAASDPHAGAIAIFEGTVRNHHKGREVLRLEYEAHRAVAEKEGQRIVREAMERFGLDATARASFALYNDQEDVSALLHGLETVRRLFA